METKFLEKSCLICQNTSHPEPANFIEFPCQHNVCFSCFPYIIYRKLETKGIQTSFFDQTQYNFECPICKKPENLLLPTKKMISFIQNSSITSSTLSDHGKKQLCEACLSNIANFCCIDCQNQIYCEECLDSIHKINKKFKNHKINEINEKEKQSILFCGCSNRKEIEFHCQECRRTICKDCLKLENHEFHKYVPLSHIFTKIKEIDQKKVNNFLKNISMDIERFQTQYLKSYQQIVSDSILEINETFEAIIEKLKTFQNSLIDALNNQIMIIQDNFQLIKIGIEKMGKELENDEILMNLNPNKYPFLIEYFFGVDFNDIDNANFEIPQDVKMNKINIVDLEKIRNIFDDEIFKKTFKPSVLSHTDKGQMIIKKQNQNTFNHDRNFTSNIETLIQNNPIIIEEGTFNPNYLKSCVSTSFTLDDETLLLWPGIDFIEDKAGSCIHVYNLSRMKKEYILKVISTKSLITVLSHYPKRTLPNEIDNLQKRFLFCATSDTFTVFGLSGKDKFKKILTIDSKSGERILSAVVFNDIFSEMEKFNKKSKDTYAILSFEDEKAPLQIYKIDGNKTVALMLEIANPCQTFCWSMNYYYNENLSKCFIVFGFRGCIKVYELATGTWQKEYKTEDSDVLSLEIFQRKERKPNGQMAINYYLIVGLWGKNNNLMFCDLSNSGVISKISVPNTEYINDVSIWSCLNENGAQEFALAACENENSIKIFTKFRMLKVLYRFKLTQTFRPGNLRKVLVRDVITGLFKEHLVVLQWENTEKNSVLLF